MDSRAPADINRPQTTTDMLKMACEIPKPWDNNKTRHTAVKANSMTDKVVTLPPPTVTNLDTVAIADNTLSDQETEVILGPFPQTECTENTNVKMNRTAHEIVKMYEKREHSTTKKTRNEKFKKSNWTCINISPILSSDISNTQLTYDSIWHNKMESIALT